MRTFVSRYGKLIGGFVVVVLLAALAVAMVRNSGSKAPAEVTPTPAVVIPVGMTQGADGKVYDANGCEVFAGAAAAVLNADGKCQYDLGNGTVQTLERYTFVQTILATPTIEAPAVVADFTQTPIPQLRAGGPNTNALGYTDYGGAQVPPVASGGNFITTKTKIRSFDDGWNRLINAENGEDHGCSWSNLWKISKADAGVSYYWPHCWEFRLNGTGEFIFEVKPDNTENGYTTSDFNNLGLAFWVSGNNATVQISRDGGATWSEVHDLSSSSNGIDFPLDGPAVMMKFVLNDGIVYLPLGEKVPTGDLPTW